MQGLVRGGVLTIRDSAEGISVGAPRTRYQLGVWRCRRGVWAQDDSFLVTKMRWEVIVDHGFGGDDDGSETEVLWG